jgi:hypothetical protein
MISKELFHRLAFEKYRGWAARKFLDIMCHRQSVLDCGVAIDEILENGKP